MGFRGVTFSEQFKKSMDDAMIYDTFLNHAKGSLKGCEVTKVSNHVHISSGYFMMCGRLVNIYDTEILAPEEEIINKKYMRLVFTIDLSKHNTEVDFNQGYFEFLSSSDAYPELVEEDLFDGGKLHQMAICKFEMSEDYGMQMFENELKLIDIGDVFGQLENIETIINDIENGKYATVEELERVETELKDEDKKLADEIERVETELKDEDKKLADEIERVETELKDEDKKLADEIERVETELKEEDKKLADEIERVETELKDEDKKLADEIEAINKNIVNKNLLLNANFKISELVNQRGRKLYTQVDAIKYGFDMWAMHNKSTSTCTLDLSGEYLKYKCDKTETDKKYFSYIRQGFESFTFFKNKTVTFSVALKSNIEGQVTLVRRNTTFNTFTKDVNVGKNKEVVSFTFNAEDGLQSVAMYNYLAQELELYGAKLEFGDKSTLYFDEKGELCGLDDDTYGEKLEKCQRFLQPVCVPQSPLMADASQLVIPTGIMKPMRTEDGEAEVMEQLVVHDCSNSISLKDAVIFNVGATLKTTNYGATIRDEDPEKIPEALIPIVKTAKAYTFTNNSNFKYENGKFYTINRSSIVGNKIDACSKLLISSEIKF